MDYDIARLFALDVTERCRGKDFIDWALTRLQNGSKEINIAILAGLSADTTYFEAKEYFLQALGELGVVEPDAEKKLDIYIESAAKGIVEDRIGFEEFLEFCREVYILRTQYKPRRDLKNMYLLCWAIRELKAGDPSWSYYYEDLDVRNPLNSVKLECKVLLGNLETKV